VFWDLLAQYLKKSWKLKSNKFSKSATFGTGLTSFGLKEDPFAFINQLTTEFYRAMSVPTLRGGFLQLLINDINMGYFWNEEDVDDQYLISRFGNAAGNLYKGNMNAMLSPVGQGNPADYPDLMCGYDNQPVPCYEQSSGNGDWSDLANFIAYLNNASDSFFLATIEGLFDVESYLRTTVIEVWLPLSALHPSLARSLVLTPCSLSPSLCLA
jgi:spore coat protein CotH